MGLFNHSNYAVLMEGPGRLVYREGNDEFVFPVFEEDGNVIICGEPSKRRIHYFFGWYLNRKALSTSGTERILPRLIEYFRRMERVARIFDRGDPEGKSFVFYPELFEARGRASEILEKAGFAWFSHYGSIDLLHEEYGLEVCGIKEEIDVEPIGAAMRAGFPQWHFCWVCHKDCGREPGWKYRIHMFRRRSADGRFVDAE